MNDYIIIPLTKGQITIIDAHNIDLADLKWHARLTKRGTYYAARQAKHPTRPGKQIPEYLARVILARKLGRPLEKHELADHKNGNTLDNTEQNVRLADYSGNAQNAKKYKNNKSGYKGVDYQKREGKWRARIRVNGRKIFIGLFDTPKLAGQAYQKAALEHHQEFARLEQSFND